MNGGRLPSEPPRKLEKVQSPVGALCNVAGIVVGICAQPGDVFTLTTSLLRASGAAKIGVSSADKARLSLAAGTRRVDCRALARWVFERGCEKNISEHTRTM